MSKLKVIINGKDAEIDKNSTIKDLLNDLQVTGSMFVVEKNLEIVPKENYNSIIQNGDKFEVVSLFGGG